ncbi:acyltransferase family protein [Arthrobacter antioxidans]|uniref:acyltransferase family protein n=1 Tax=Arthrobacter antioxidans TaxID=2895818 RepID=UPI001FFEE445|nr:acyltransferase family protein [Arthrobacter antioxidans]
MTTSDTVQHHGTPPGPGSAPSAAPAGQSGTFRPEVQGLRAVALVLVVVYHVWLGRVSGGVDVFLLVSAFLLTASFARRSTDGPLGLRAYWARVFGRLLPPAAVVLLATVIASIAFFPQVRWGTLIEHAWASLLYVQNWDLAFGAVDYQAADAATASPFQHFWSLSIQGQVFILWPLILVGCILAARRTRFSFTAVAGTVFSLIFAASLAFSVHQTTTNQAFAYFDTRARLWEFAVGSLLALALPHLNLNRLTRLALGWAGILMIIACGLVVQVENQFPGWIALIPVLGAAAVITAGPQGHQPRHRLGIDRILGAAPVLSVGRISYALYLWHWPILITYLVTTGTSTVSLGEGALIIALSAVLSWGTMRLVERPLQGWSWVHRRKRRNAMLTVGCALIVAVPLSGWETRISVQEEQLAQQPAALNPGAEALLSPEEHATLPEAALLPAATDLGAEWGKAGPACDGGYRPQDEALETCHQIEPDGQATRTVVVIGDSHANQLMPALTHIAEKNQWRMITLLRNACRYGAESDARDEACNARNDAAREYVLDLQPDAVITHGTLSTAEEPHELLVPDWEAGIGVFLEDGIEVLAIRDNPRFPINMFECVELHGQDAPLCNTPRDQALLAVNPVEAIAAREPLVHSLDVTPAYCTDTTCPAVVGNVHVYMDLDHLNRTYVETFTGYFEDELFASTGWTATAPHISDQDPESPEMR